MNESERLSLFKNEHQYTMKLKPINYIKPFLTLGLIASMGNTAFADKPVTKPVDPRPVESKVQIAILLDTSGSMSGLIEQAKTQLWKTVNTFISAEKNGQVPFVEVALYEYGNDRVNSENSWIRQVQPLTRDLDKVSEHLFSLTTNGGSEYCGAAIQKAANELKWDSSKDVYKVIFIAGNEPFTQGPIDPMVSCREAYDRDIVVNTIHCGNYSTGVSQGWKSGAALASGDYLVIDHNKVIVDIKCPQDEEIARLNARLNDTYIPFGADGSRGKSSQLLQDSNANMKKESGAEVQRAISKASKNYSNSSWDLVDAYKDGKVDLEKVDAKKLPKEMQDLNVEQRIEYVKKQTEIRIQLKEDILKLNTARNKHVAEVRSKEAKSGEATLDEAIVKSIKIQAATKGYSFTE